MSRYDWDLIETLLHDVQDGAGHSFSARACADRHVETLAARGETGADRGRLQAKAAAYQQQLRQLGYIVPRARDAGGNGENFSLSARGSSLLSLLDSAIPGIEHPREVLDEQKGDPLDPAVFDVLSAKAQIA